MLTWSALTWLLTCYYMLAGIDGQSENAIGAHRIYEKTSFSCSGRPAGYYADVETGCQVYHMCDDLGRQFSYSCPNTTLFQQRMLICDHWYMVNCSRAESNYAANLLIGQRDKPFVNDEENSLRTPRPDLLDRPYAPDYSGESFRSQYKELPALQNIIQDFDASRSQDKLSTAASPGQQRWKIPPSRTIIPPAYEPKVSAKVTPQTDSGSVRFLPRTAQPPPSSTTKAPIYRTQGSAMSTTLGVGTRGESPNRYNSAGLHTRSQYEALRGQSGEHEDLGTSHSSHYNTSADFSSAEFVNSKTASNFSNNNNKVTLTPTAAHVSTSSTTTKVPIKVPSKIYEPPFVYPIYNENNTDTMQALIRTSAATPFTSAPLISKLSSTTATPPPNRPTTLAGKPFTAPSGGTTTKAPRFDGRNQNTLIQNSFNQLLKNGRTPTPAQGFKSPTRHPTVNITKQSTTALHNLESSRFDYSIPATNRLHLPASFKNITNTATVNDTVPPAKELLPPFKEFIQHDIATTQGPPIYYEWKVPSNGLEPPKLEPPYGVDGREYPEAVIDYNAISGASSRVNSSTAEQPQTLISSQLTPATKVLGGNTVTARSPTSRSIKETGQPNSVFRINVEKPKVTTRTTNTVPGHSDSVPIIPSDITQLRKDYSVPEYAFPLEPLGRTGYLSTDSYNSFQLKIPEQGADETDEHRHWFGENPKCPECHPAFVVPGTCEPCIRS